MLELRLAGHFATLKMKVGQANSSKSSDDVLDVEVDANGKQQDIRKVPFNTQQSFTVPAAGVNALKIIMYIDPDKCDPRGLTAVIEDLSVS